VAFLILFTIAVNSFGRARSEDISAFDQSLQEDHSRKIRDASVPAFPYSIGDWLARDVEAAAAAVALLRPNVLVNRTYRNLRTGETASLLFVQCSDARDLIGHYPPNCYPAHGMTLESAAPRDWDVAGVTVQGMRYRFASGDRTASATTVVDNFMVLPTGGFGRDMDAVDRVAEDTRLRHLGAAEVQIVTDGKWTDERRDEVLRALVGPTMPLIACVGGGVCRE